MVNFGKGEIYSCQDGVAKRLNGVLSGGYILHSLSLPGIRVRLRAHRIIWIAAHGIPQKNDKKYHFVIDHKNRMKWDNRLVNLRLVTQRENMICVKRSALSVIDKEIADYIRIEHKNGKSVKCLAYMLGLSITNIKKIIENKAWTKKQTKLEV